MPLGYSALDKFSVEVTDAGIKSGHGFRSAGNEIARREGGGLGKGDGGGEGVDVGVDGGVVAKVEGGGIVVACWVRADGGVRTL